MHGASDEKDFGEPTVLQMLGNVSGGHVRGCVWRNAERKRYGRDASESCTGEQMIKSKRKPML